jgi:hypothetical protein
VISKIDRALLQKLKKILHKNEQFKNEFSERLKEEPYIIDKYIVLLGSVKDKTLEEKLLGCQAELLTANQIFELIEEFQIAIDERLLRFYLESRAWVSNLNELKRLARVKLENTIPQFKKELSVRKNNLFYNFNVVLEKISVFKGETRLDYQENQIKIARNFYDVLKELITSGEELNSKETILNYEVTEFKTVAKSYDDFY